MYAHGEVFVSKKRMGERVVGSTSSASNVHEAANDNTNPYRNMVMDVMRMNQGNVSQCPILEEELNADAARFFDLLKDSDEPLLMQILTVRCWQPELANSWLGDNAHWRLRSVCCTCETDGKINLNEIYR
jgi:hypothetical protein